MNQPCHKLPSAFRGSRPHLLWESGTLWIVTFHTELWTQTSLFLEYSDVLPLQCHWEMYEATSKIIQRKKSEFIKKSANYNTLMDEARGKHLSTSPEMVIGLLSEAWGLHFSCNFISARILLLPFYIKKKKSPLLSLKYFALKDLPAMQFHYTTISAWN